MTSGTTELQIQGEHAASVFPTRHEELRRLVRLTGTFRLDGGIFAHDIVVDGTGTVRGPVYARQETVLHLPVDEDKSIRFNSGVGARKAITCRVPRERAERASLRAGARPPLFVLGSVFADSVNLCDALVVGNIEGRNVNVARSIVIGSIRADNDATIADTTLLSFQAGRVELRGHNSLWLPYGIAQTEITFVPDANVRYLALCRSAPHGCATRDSHQIRCDKFATGKCPSQGPEFPYGDILLGPEDIREEAADSGTVKILTLAPRILNMDAVNSQVRRVEDFVRAALIFEHLDRESQEIVLNGSLQPQERQLLREIVAATTAGSTLPPDAG